jgi:uncharacterized protein (TIGR03492 family)
VVVGDVFLLLLSRMALPHKPVFIATAKSNYHVPHTRLERAVLRRVPRVVITRDEVTCAALTADRIPARFFGNVLMDGFGPRSAPQSDVPGVLLLPGSRAEAAANLTRMLEVAAHVELPARWTCAVSPALSGQALAAAGERAGWRLDGTRLVNRSHSVELIEGAFERLLAEADVVLGVAGTANEQAAGLGCPVVSFPGVGVQAGAQRLREQAQLLGDAAAFVEHGVPAVARELSRLLTDPAERRRRGEAGRLRMGPPGADAITRFLADELQTQSGRSPS